MKILELTGYKNLPAYRAIVDYSKVKAIGTIGDENKDALYKVSGGLEQLGWQRLGQGVFGTVYGNQTKPYVLKIFKGDHYYIEFLREMRRFKNNPHVPKLYGRGKPIKISNAVYAIRLEKLKVATTDELKKYIDPKLLVKYPSAREWSRLIFADGNYDFLIIHYPSLAWLIQNIIPVDIHDGNVMMRGNTLVLIDV